MSDGVLLYWAVLYTQGNEVSGLVSVTDGERAPHTVNSVRRAVEIRHGSVDELSAVGPMLTRELAEDYLRAATATQAGLNFWLEQAS
ncbi:hypothetical protein [Streptomyces sp. CBMA123]|uniref:hypothetical protein n=1 Tax=Streptomyces sp. CBMA123 TaxID=1896313 RepID=UPI001661D808|nr:hypothetical protein [Streptomyces sp. CBMA123]MBD0689639.1 hypothetical protein [Streptomyces sp. CBMA123]